jgi:hypothetical protein
MERKTAKMAVGCVISISESTPVVKFSTSEVETPSILLLCYLYEIT